ncbi:MAG TPA: hypothetical protein VH419_04200, partial [Nocardioidaceae bacterium]
DQRVVSSWFTGFTPQLSTAVTLTRGDGTKPLDGYLDTFFGADYPTLTWTEYMKVALAGEPVKDFPDPAELHGENPTFSPPPTTYQPTTAAPSTSAPPATTSEPPSTSTPPPTTPPTTSTPPPTEPTTEPTEPTEPTGPTEPTTPTTTTTTTTTPPPEGAAQPNARPPDDN